MSRKSSRSEWVVIMGHPFHKMEMLKVFGFILLALLLLIGATTYFLYDYLTVTPEEEELVEVHVASKEGPDFQQHPVEYFIEQHFLKTKYNEVNSIRALGSYTSEDIVLDFQLLAKKPSYYKQVLEANQRKIEVGFDGEELWLEQNHPILDEENVSLMRLNKALAILECAIPCLAWEYQTGLARQDTEVLSNFIILPEKIWNDRECVVVKNLSLLESPVFHYIDNETGLEVYRRSVVSVGDGVEKEVELFYAEPMEGLKYPIPSGFELFVDGKLFCTAEFERIEINRGLMSYLFKKPESD